VKKTYDKSYWRNTPSYIYPVSFGDTTFRLSGVPSLKDSHQDVDSHVVTLLLTLWQLEGGTNPMDSKGSMTLICGAHFLNQNLVYTPIIRSLLWSSECGQFFYDIITYLVNLRDLVFVEDIWWFVNSLRPWIEVQWWFTAIDLWS